MSPLRITIVLMAIAACAMAAEEVRDKKQVLLGDYGMTYGFDDGKYWPGKYEKTIVAPVHTMPAAIHTFPALHPMGISGLGLSGLGISRSIVL